MTNRRRTPHARPPVAPARTDTRRRGRPPGARPGPLLAVGLAALLAAARPGSAQEYEIFAVRYGVLEGFPLRGLLPDAPAGEAIDIAMAIWVVRGGDRVILVDTGFFRDRWLSRYHPRDYRRPDEALAPLSIDPADVTDVVISHAHWDHVGGIELFPDATLWIQRAEYAYYTGTAWQEGGRRGGIDEDDVVHLVERNTRGSVRLIDGDSVEVAPGITVLTGARHTFSSQYVLVDGPEPFVLASDNAYLYRNVVEGRAGATFAPEDRGANVAALRRMIRLAGDPGRVVPGHDLLQFERFEEVADGIVRITGPSRDGEGTTDGSGHTP